MCGIFGTSGYVNKQLIMEMSDALKHRGPDDAGFFIDDKVALGNTRLSIIDLKGGHQPIHNEDSTLWITFNGEIYNFHELRPKLVELEHQFYTNSDTEVIIHAFEEWGDDCVSKFNGMWAFAIWDSTRKRLFLSRDRLGVKPLYYYFDGKKFIFASEIKAILREKSIPRTPNDRIIYEYLAYGRHDHVEQTFFAGIKRLLPAHNLTVDHEGIRLKKYWDIERMNKAMDWSAANDEISPKQFFDMFTRSVRLQLESEVPVGTCLSGGLDSSSIVVAINKLLFPNSAVAKQVGKRQKTFSALFDDRSIDERRYANEVIKSTNAERNVTFPSSKGLWDEIEKVVYHQDEPFMSSSVYAQWCLMKLVSEKVKVVLDGQGGDELLAGYETYYPAFLRDLWNKKEIYHFLKELFLSLDITLPLIRDYITSSSKRKLIGTRKLLKTEFIREFDGSSSTQASRDIPEILRDSLFEGSLQSLLRYEDRNSMAFSVEARVPFLDHQLVEYVFSLPVTQRLNNGWTKYVLRNAMKGTLPEKIRKRRSKIGFRTPEVAWLRELKSEIRDLLASPDFGKRKYFEQEEILKEFDRLCDGKAETNANALWRIINLEIWFRVFFDHHRYDKHLENQVP